MYVLTIRQLHLPRQTRCFVTSALLPWTRAGVRRRGHRADDGRAAVLPDQAGGGAPVPDDEGAQQIRHGAFINHTTLHDWIQLKSRLLLRCRRTSHSWCRWSGRIRTPSRAPASASTSWSRRSRRRCAEWGAETITHIRLPIAYNSIHYTTQTPLNPTRTFMTYYQFDSAHTHTH